MTSFYNTNIVCTMFNSYCRFNGINVRSHHIKDLDPDTFSKKLTMSLDLWKKEGRRGIWIKISIDQSDLIPVATKVGVALET